MEKIIIKDAYEHNLKHLNLEIPLNAFTCVTGCSGCGKSSLVFDTIYAESQRAFLEGITGNVYGQKLMNKPKVGYIKNLHPALNISQNYYNVNPRSTIGTMTDISYYLRSLFAIINSNQETTISDNIFSSNNPKSFCPNCFGLGTETVISKNLLIPDREKTLKDGAILFFKGSPESKEQKYLEAFCEYYNIDLNKKFSQLTKKEIDCLLYANDQIKYKLSYKEGKRRKQHYVTLQGVITTIQTHIKSKELKTSSIYSKYMEDVPCHICGGAKLNQNILKYKVDGLNYAEIENMEFTALLSWIHQFDSKYLLSSKKSLISQLLNVISIKLKSLIQLNVGYLCLSRTIPSLSDGERQRVRIASQLTCSLKGLIYILDEPCKGLHYKDITNIIQATKNLIKQGNTVIAIEHNKQYISASNYIIELGPVGGPKGGYLINKKTNFSLPKNKLTFKSIYKSKQYFEINNIHFRNIQNQNVRFPIGGITCITGISGSGKSTLASVIASCFSKRAYNYCDSFCGENFIKRVIQVNQSPIGKTPRSTVVSFLDIFNEIRTLFSETEMAHKLNLNASSFSMNVKGGRCEYCQGTGLKKFDLNYLPSSYITCPECNGKRFNKKILSVTFHGKTIHDVLETPIFDIINLFKGTKKIFSVLSSMIELGLGYLKLGQMSMNLSGGEAQRIKLAKALGIASHGQNLYILDEPTSGLDASDVNKFINILFSLQKKHETIVIIEHNINFITKVSDYIIDFGTSCGNLGGKISIQGLPKDVFSCKNSSLYQLDHLSI